MRLDNDAVVDEGGGESAALYSSLLACICTSNASEFRQALAQFRAQSSDSDTANQARRVLNQTDRDGFKLIHRACSIGQLDICRELLLSGADPNALTSQGDSALHWACFTGDYAVCDLLLKHGADPLLASTADGKTPLEAAMEEKHGHVLQLFFCPPWKSLFRSQHVPSGDSVLYSGALKIKFAGRAKTCWVVLSLLCRTVFIFHDAQHASRFHQQYQLAAAAATSASIPTGEDGANDSAAAAATAAAVAGGGDANNSLQPGFDSIPFDQLLCVRRRSKDSKSNKFVVYVSLPARYAQRDFFSTEEEIASETGREMSSAVLLGGGSRSGSRMLAAGVAGSSLRLPSFRRSASSSYSANRPASFVMGGARAAESAVVTVALRCQPVNASSNNKWVDKLKQAGVLGRTLAAVRLQALVRGYLARQLLARQRRHQLVGQELVRDRSAQAAATLPGKYVALDAEHTPAPGGSSTPTASSSSTALTQSSSSSSSSLVFAVLRRASSGGVGGGSAAAKIMLQRRNSGSFSFRSSSSGGSSTSTLGLPVDDAFTNFEDISGFLKKRSETGVSAQLRLWKSRFAILSHTKAQLQYYDHTKDVKRRKIKRIDFSSMLSVSKLAAPATAFVIRLVGGTTYRFDAVDLDDCQRWITSLRAVLPRDNVAALAIQRVFRGYLARRRVGQLRLLVHRKQEDARLQEQASMEAARQRSFAEHAKRKLEEEDAQRKLDELEAESFARRQAEKRKQLAKSIALPPHWRAYVDATTGRLYYYNKKTKQTKWKLPTATTPSPSKAARADEDDEWKEHVDESTGRAYFVNARTKQSSWTRPQAQAAAAVASSPQKPSTTTTTITGQWKRHRDAESQRYFYMNERTGERSWTKPAVPADKAWIALVDASTHREYFTNSATGESAWALPPGHSLYRQEDDFEEAMIAHLQFLLQQQTASDSGDDAVVLLRTGHLQQAVQVHGGVLLCRALEKIDAAAVDARVFDQCNMNLVTNTLCRLTSGMGGAVKKDGGDGDDMLAVVWQVLQLDLLLPVSILSFPGLVAACKREHESVEEFHRNVSAEDKLKRWYGLSSGTSTWAEHGLEALARKLGLAADGEADVFAHCHSIGLPLYCANNNNSRGHDERAVFALCAAVFRAFPPKHGEDNDALVSEVQLDALHEQERTENVLHNWFAMPRGQSLYAHVRDGTVLVDFVLRSMNAKEEDLGSTVTVHRHASATREEWLENAELAMELAALHAADVNGNNDGGGELLVAPTTMRPADLVDGNASALLPWLYFVLATSFKLREMDVLLWCNQTVKRYASARQRPTTTTTTTTTTTVAAAAAVPVSAAPLRASVKFIERPLVVVQQQDEEEEEEEEGEEVTGVEGEPTVPTSLPPLAVPQLKSALMRRSQFPLASACRDISSFRDRTLANGCYLLCLLHAVLQQQSAQPAVAVNWKLMMDPSSGVTLTAQEARALCERNAQYLMGLANIALKPPAVITWEDVVEVNSRAIFCFAATLMKM